MARSSAQPSASARYHGSSKIVPKDPSPQHQEVGPDAKYPKYPSTIDFASCSEDHSANVDAGMKKRRPDGRRGHSFGGPFHKRSTTKGLDVGSHRD